MRLGIWFVQIDAEQINSSIKNLGKNCDMEKKKIERERVAI